MWRTGWVVHVLGEWWVSRSVGRWGVWEWMDEWMNTERGWDVRFPRGGGGGGRGVNNDGWGRRERLLLYVGVLQDWGRWGDDVWCFCWKSSVDLIWSDQPHGWPMQGPRIWYVARGYVCTSYVCMYVCREYSVPMDLSIHWMDCTALHTGCGYGYVICMYVVRWMCGNWLTHERWEKA